MLRLSDDALKIGQHYDSCEFLSRTPGVKFYITSFVMVVSSVFFLRMAIWRGINIRISTLLCVFVHLC